MKRINDLLEVPYDFIVEGITDDSRSVKKNYIFVATKGYNVDHYDYIDDAIKKGCCFVIVDRDLDITFPHIVVDKIDDYYKQLCLKYYDLSLDDFHFIGITGTDGKTTTASIVKELLDCAYIGTNGLKIHDDYYITNNTTPCVSELYQDLKRIKESNLSSVVMEVSSEALLHGRVDNFLFDFVAITNITGDHLNVHGSFENYVQSKLKILSLLKPNGFAILNGDDDHLNTIHSPKTYTFGFHSTNDYVIEKVSYYSRNTKIFLKHGNHHYHIISPFIGKYNVYNVVLAFIIGLLSGIDESILKQKIQSLPPIPGRCEFLDFGQDYDLVLDYAHTINGIKTIIDTFQNYKRIITVTGAAGGREKDKRPVIGKMVIEKSTIAIFTMDDPRYESVDDIIDQMVGEEKDYIRIVDRKEAIHYALSIAKMGDIVLILGKGRDSYMAVEDKKVSYCDYDVIYDYSFQKKN